MANTGMKMPVFCVESQYAEGSPITYKPGKVMAHAIAATVTKNLRDNPLYADNTKVENDKGITDYSIELEIDDIEDEIRAELLGEVAIGDGTVTEYAVQDKNPPYVGFGYLTNKIKGGIEKWEGFFFHRVQFATSSEGATTKRESVEWQTPKLSGTGFGVVIDSTGAIDHFRHMNFATEAEATAWLKSKANIT